jgi:A/G-specific adenine glycosylase
VTGSIQGSFAERLLSWWDEHGRKDLPWQTSRNPYRVWISEIMLQQTQVTTVIPYFNKWMESFPDLETLAKAPLDEVLAHWSGLGYYARARNLHKAAAICVELHHSGLPGTAEELANLPGIGESTANAIISQSTGQPAAVLDGNVKRVLARHAAIEGWAGKAVVQRQLWQEARDRLPMGKGDDYTQAVMDLGATICTRSNPYCERCPVNQDCRALLQDLTGRLPTPNPPSKVTDLDLHMLILQDDEGRVLLEKRPPAGIWGGLWCLPSDESLEKIESGLGTIGVDPRPLEHFEHRLSHRRIRIYPWLAISPRPTGVKCDDRVSWCDATRQQSLGVPKPVSDLLNRLDNGEFE